MNRYQKLMSRIEQGERILIDGATGTETERRGVPQLEHAWNGGGALSHPDILREIHQDYIRHDAEIVISDTFATTQHALRDAGVGHQFEILNRRGVEIACEARQQLEADQVLVAGGISYWSWTGDHPDLDELKSSVSKQAKVMTDSGADLIMLEMMVDIDRMMVTLEASQECGLPVWVGLTCNPNNEGEMCLRNGETLVEALAALEAKPVPVLSIMHSEVKHVDACLDILDQHWDGVVGVYAHSGGYKNSTQEWRFEDMISPASYAQVSERWLNRGVQVIGGCCGIGPNHIKVLSGLV
jgi:S-methylmethionine-dependent homocysteine/selenocysteine methylase